MTTFIKTVNDAYEVAIHRVINGLIEEGFEILTEFHVAETSENRLVTDLRKYNILGALDPRSENKDCVALPCKVTVKEQIEGFVKVSAIDPVGSVQFVGNSNLEKFAQQVKEKLQKVINRL